MARPGRPSSFKKPTLTCDERRAQIFKAAHTVAKRVGFHHMTRRQIAEEADVSIVLVSQHFAMQELTALLLAGARTVEEKLALLGPDGRLPHEAHDGAF